MTPRVVLTVVGGVDDVGVVQLPSFLKLLNCTNTQRHPTHSSQQKLPTITGLKAGMMLMCALVHVPEEQHLCGCS